MINLHFVLNTLALICFGAGFMAVVPWLLLGIVLFNPFVGLLLLVVSPFVKLMANKANKDKAFKV